MESKKSIFYANLNSFNSLEGTTDDQMRRFFEKYFEDKDTEIVDVIVDRCEDAKPLNKRDGWTRLLEQCANEKVDFVVVPTIQMLGGSISTIVDIAKELDFKYDTHIYAMYEELGSKEAQFKPMAEFFATVQYNQEKLNQRALKIRDVFFKATGVEGVPSAVPIYVDYDQYIKTEKIAHDYGLSMRELVSSLLSFASISRQNPALEEHLFGLEHPKPMRGRPPKGRKQTTTR